MVKVTMQHIWGAEMRFEDLIKHCSWSAHKPQHSLLGILAVTLVETGRIQRLKVTVAWPEDSNIAVALMCVKRVYLLLQIWAQC